MEATKGIPVTIHMKTTIHDGGQTEETALKSEGQLYQKGTTTYVRFEEPSEEEGYGTSMQTIKIQDNEISVSRNGAVTMNQRFIPGVETEGMLHSPYGQMTMLTKTSGIEFRWNKALGAGRLRLQYGLHLQGNDAGNYDLRVIIKEVEHK
ncbi:MAG: DUF1934 domain-containing protein [Bacillus sp. (in: Bacteria)]|nr:DUF1934 domain-containing protein [Bacillus sp. (in: firmicutes)]